MQPEPTEHSSSAASNSLFGSSDSPLEHGLPHDDLHPARSPPDNSVFGGDSSEWSLSPSTSASGWGSPSGRDAGLNSPSSAELEARTFNLDSPSDIDLTAIDADHGSEPIQARSSVQGDGSTLHESPEEILFQIMSHLPPVDLLTVKLVSRRFYHLVTSPQAWASAFSRFFPGPEILKTSADVVLERDPNTLRTEQRNFTRISASASWSSEYLTRTRLLRCLDRGRPALPIASPAPGKPGKGSATFTFSSRLAHGCTSLHADFGSPFDKRKPQFIHGYAPTGGVTTSDRRGKFDAWGFTSRVAFRHFAETHPGRAMWGLGQGTVCGVPNVMDVSQPYGMVYGEGTPGGTVFHLGSNDKHGGYLSPFLNLSFSRYGIPHVSQDSQCTSAVWIAKTPNAPRLSRGMIGILTGSSSGVLSAYSLGSPTKFDQRFDRGQLTARWMLSPGVPIIAIEVDDGWTQERLDNGRVWVVVLNALGELFHLKGLPTVTTDDVGSSEQPESIEEIRAWESGKSVEWRLVESSRRSHRSGDNWSWKQYPDYLPRHVFGHASDLAEESSAWSRWTDKSPAEIRAQFSEWDMRRRLDVDFANDDEQAAGEAIVVYGCGNDDDQSASVRRFMRFKVDAPADTTSNVPEKAAQEPLIEASQQASWSFASLRKEESVGLEDSITTLKPVRTLVDNKSVDQWRVTDFNFGNFKNVVITATAIDCSTLAKVLPSEDPAIRKLQLKTPDSTEVNIAKRIPGQSARFVAVGTAAGNIFLWNTRAAASHFSDLMNEVKPLRIIETESPGIASLALNGLYLVHGGEEGLVQAWDPLASTLEPVRTISSRYRMNNRRRAVVAAQQNQGAPAQTVGRSTLDASAICIDPDSHVLRGVVAFSGLLRYWSFSNVPMAEDFSRSQKRRLRRAKGTSAGALLNTEMHGSHIRGGKWHPRGVINQELANRKVEEQIRRHEQREERRVAGRFGLELLGEDASEDEMLAYAKLLSEEETELQAKRAVAAEAKARGLETPEELEAQKFALSDADAEKWKYASWEERYKMLPEHALPPKSEADDLATPTKPDEQVDEELRRALQLSMEDQGTASTATSSRPPSSANALHDAAGYDADLAEALALSMSEADMASSPPTGSIGGSPSRSQPLSPSSSEDSDLARAIKASLDVGPSTPTGASCRPSVLADDAFPALSSSPSPRASPSLGGAWGSMRKGKGRG